MAPVMVNTVRNGRFGTAFVPAPPPFTADGRSVSTSQRDGIAGQEPVSIVVADVEGLPEPR